MGLTVRERWALAGLGLIGVITAGWWALALWPTPANSPEWLLRASAVCFGSTETGLPNAGGWILLIGQPLGMLGVLVVAWWSEVRGGLAKLSASGAGRTVLLSAGFAFVAGAAAAGARVAEARASAVWSEDDLVALGTDLPVPPGLGSTPPALGLIDQRGEHVTLGAFLGRPVLVTFGFGHCETICPLVVHSARRVQEMSDAPQRPVLLVVTLDPWRDTPARLAGLATRWSLGEDAFVLGGSVEAVNAALDAWGVPRARNGTTGDITHPPLTYVVDPAGALAHATTGDTNRLMELLSDL